MINKKKLGRPFKPKDKKFLRVECSISPVQHRFIKQHMISPSNLLQKSINEKITDKFYQEMHKQDISEVDFKKEVKKFENERIKESEEMDRYELSFEIRKIQTIINYIKKTDAKYLEYFQGQLELRKELLGERSPNSSSYKISANMKMGKDKNFDK